MTGGVFVGRPRPLWKVLLYSLLTLGVYGRVHVYKSAKEIDGHEALFLDLRLWLLGVILPVVGPLVLKWRLLHHLEPMVRHDATAPRLHVQWLRLTAFVPLLPVYHVLVQRHLSHHWTLHRKIADLQAREEVLEQRRASARTEEDREEIQRLETDLRMRADVLKQAREAAVEIREAHRARQRAEEEIRAAGGAPSALQRIKRFAPAAKLKFRRRGAEEAQTEAAPPEPEAPPQEPPRRQEPEREPEPAPVMQPPPPMSDGLPNPDDPELSKAERKALKRHLDAQAQREESAQRRHDKNVAKARKAAEKAGAPEPSPEPSPVSEPSKKEAKWLARFERAREKRQRAESKARDREERKAAREAEKGAEATSPGVSAPAKNRFGFLRRGREEAPGAAPASEPIPEPAPEPVPPPEDEAPPATPRKPRAAKRRARSPSKKK